MRKNGRAITVTALSLLVSCTALFPAQAAPPSTMDVFSNVTPGSKTKPSLPALQSAAAQKVAAMTPETNPALGAGSMAMMSKSSPQLTWFENFDTTVFSLLPNDEAKVILKRSFNQEAERVVKWTETATKVAHNYRLLAKTLKNAPIPGNSPALKEYQSLSADWYNDKASVYEDLVRPRAAARTMEELEAQLKEINDRAESIFQQGKELHAMDMHLRGVYNVHQARETDALWHYVSGDKLKASK
jgi:hypothetical protein